MSGREAQEREGGGVRVNVVNPAMVVKE